MLTELVVENLGAIERAEVALTHGSSALTGETGAGKTMMVTALGLLSGGRAERALVRQGAKLARIDGLFAVPSDHPALTSLADIDRSGEVTEVVLTRVVAADGGSRARINNRPVTLAVLAAVGGELIEIAGQNEHHRLGRPVAQRTMLDAYAGEAAIALAEEVAQKVGEVTRLRADLAALVAGERERAREVDLTRYEIKEIESVDPRIGESEELTAAAARLEHAEALAAGRSAASHLLKGEGGAQDDVAGAIREIDALVDKDPALEDPLVRLRDVEIEISDIASDLAANVVASDPRALAEARDRIGALARLQRKYGVDDAAVLDHLERARTRLEDLSNAESTAAAVGERLDRATDEATSAATELSKVRAAAAARLGQELAALLGDLAMPGAIFEARLEPRELYEGGLETVSFLVSADPGAAPGPIGKIASGGELSRISLALWLLTARSSATTMVFDEVDTGVGGAAARAVGGCLAELARRTTAQVIVVTHLPQVAACTDHQFRVVKERSSGRLGASIERVDGPERVEEISRMLAGFPESSTAREHAQELLELASGSAS